MFYSKSTGGFYATEIHGENIPEDAVEITTDQRAALLIGQAEGQRIVADDNGNPRLAAPLPPSPAQVIAAYERAVQAQLDAAAKAAGYDDIQSAISYADEPAVAKYQQDGQSFRAWRSLCWSYCYTRLAAVQEQERSQPTIDAFLDELPALDLP